MFRDESVLKLRTPSGALGSDSGQMICVMMCVILNALYTYSVNLIKFRRKKLDGLYVQKY